ncbi:MULTISPECIES: Pycsar system effector family protein [Acinetobacter]|jgi:hypothetical protein|uniref:Pycsar system effector family protein n=1 Tax=Acinetobacter TaxID=469 RepID=UPI00123AE461|nr:MULTISPECIES: Pycsar system effector family protein [Acinetobacter]WAU73638.1 DUF5706 domain-containing protein [Acinetobacter sp. TR11]
MTNFDIDKNIEKNQWLLEKQLNWISNGDVKIGAIVTLNLALLAGLGSYFNAKEPLLLLDILYAITVIIIIVSIYFCKLGFRPKFDPPNQSNIFFGTIAKNDLTTFVQSIDNITKETYSEDLSNQIYRNAKIASMKYEYLSKATSVFLVASVFWIITLSITLFTNKYSITQKEPEKPTKIELIK